MAEYKQQINNCKHQRAIYRKSTQPLQSVFFRSPFDDRGKGERRERVSLAAVELVLELDPVETQRVQERRQPLHAEQDADGQS